jgi:hypothetical protein
MNAMRNAKTSARRQVLEDSSPMPAASFVGRLTVGRPGQLLVDCGRGPVAARHAARLSREALIAGSQAGREVLVVFDGGDPARPVVVDFVADPSAPVQEAQVDGERVVIEGRREILLRCGKAYILIREDGQVVIKGTNLLSRSTGVNKIKGGAVRIN